MVTSDQIQIIKGDAYRLIKSIPNESVDIIYTDIPYLTGMSGGGSLKAKLGKYIKEETKDFVDGIDYSILEEFIRVSKKINIFIWCSKSQILDIANFFDKYEVDFNILTWTKTNPVPFGNSIWLSDIEYCLHFYKEAGFNVGARFKKKGFVSSVNKKDKKDYLHPTIKPLEMVKNHLANFIKPDSVIFDPFLGSGTTAVAAKELGVKFIGFEIDDKYYKISKDRVNGITYQDRLEIDEGKLDIFDFI